jgi:hypothetical protein
MDSRELNFQKNKMSPLSALNCSKFVLNLLKHSLTNSEEAVFKKGLNLTIAVMHSNLDMVFAVELVVSKLPACTTVEFRWKIQPVLEKTLH